MFTFGQAFDARIGDIYDQAVYFGAGSGTRGGQGSDASEEFRQGLEGTERQRMYNVIEPLSRKLTRRVQCSLLFRRVQSR
jgi:hypothetical protein